MMKHLKQLHGIRGLLPYLKTKRPTVLLIFFLSVIDAGLSLLPIQIIAAVVDLLSTGRSAFSPILGTSLTLHLVFFGVVYASKHAVSLAYGHTNTMLSTGIIESLRDDAMTWALESYKPYKEERREGDIVSRISGDVEAVVRAVAGPLNGLLPMVLKMIGSVVMMFVWSPVLGAISLALVLPLYEPLHYALAAGASLLAFAAAAVLCRGGPVGEEAGKAPPEKAEEPIEKKPASTGNPELDKMVRDGEMAIREMKRLDENIADPGISADIVRLEQVSARIFDEVRTHPEKLPQIRRFLDYYLPTTLKLLNAYDRMSGTGVSGENIDTTLAKVEGMMRTIVAAFEKQLDSLYGAEALDISTDITVLENMMAREGLVDSPLKAEPDEKKETDIRLEL